MTERVADTLRRDSAVMAAVASVEWGSAPSPDFGDAFPLVRVTPGRPPVRRRAMGTGSGPDLHAPMEVSASIECAVITDRRPTSADAQRDAWAIAQLVEAALARNARLADADGGDRLVHTLELGQVQVSPRLVGRERMGVVVYAMATSVEHITS